MIDPFEYDPNGAYHDPNGVDEQTLGWNNYSGSSPSEGYTAYLWPPSIHEAAQYVYQAASPSRQPDNVRFEDLMITAEEPWRLPHAAPRSYRDREQNIELLQANRLPPAYGGRSFLAGDLGIASSSLIEGVVPPPINHLNDHEYDSPQIVNKTKTLRCLICVDNPTFTGQYAQRNLTRHMEKHSPCTGTDSGRHIRCGQPGCMSTFARPDALLIHLRRSHPELNTPPPKKRKREE